MAGSGRASAVCSRPIYEGNEISCLQIEVLNTELRCPICLNILRDPVATECMHRFCAGCIEKCLRVGKKECPTCRKPVATRRNLRNDTNFQDLITKLYPDLEDFEEEEDRLISNVASRARMVAVTAEQQQDMIKHQRNHPPSRHYHAPSYNAPKRPRPQAVGGGGGGGGGPGGHDIYESDGMDESGTEEGGASESFEDEDGDEDMDDEALEDGEGEEDYGYDAEMQRHTGQIQTASWSSRQKQGRSTVPAHRRQDHGPQNILAPRPNEVGFARE
jgi:E3 ubiquitin-protein ligase RNF1/2